LPSDFALRHERKEEDGAAAAAAAAAGAPRQPPPVLLSASPGGALFHKPDARWGAPKAVVCLDVRLAGAGASPRSYLLTELATLACLEALNEELYAATVAGLHYDLGPSVHGVLLSVDGFSHKLSKLAATVCEAFAALGSSDVDAEVYARVKSALELRLANSGFDASTLATTTRQRALDAAMPSAEELVAELGAASPAALRAHVRQMLVGGAHVAAYVGGNLDAAEARACFDGCVAALGAPPPLPASARLDEGCARLVGGGAHPVVALPAKNPAETNCAVELYFQLAPQSAEEGARLSLLEHIMFEPLFDSLRTKQQLGYSVGCSARCTAGTLGFVVYLVSATHAAAQLEAAARAFLAEWVPTLASMAPAAYARNVAAAAANKLIDDHNLGDEASRYFSEIKAQQYMWGRAEAEAAAMRKLDQAEFAAWAADVLCERPRRLSIHVRPPKGDAADDALPEGARRVDSAEAAREGLAVEPMAVEPLPEVG
jgi:secreted Zn-dependent insulinase-like peptidase